MPIYYFRLNLISFPFYRRKYSLTPQERERVCLYFFLILSLCPTVWRVFVECHWWWFGFGIAFFLQYFFLVPSHCTYPPFPPRL